MQRNDGAGSSTSDGSRMDWATSSPATAAASTVNESWRRAQDALQSIGAQPQQAPMANATQPNPYAWGTPAYYPQAGYGMQQTSYGVPPPFNPFAPPPAAAYPQQFPLQFPVAGGRPASTPRQPTHYPPPRPIQQQHQSPSQRPTGYPPRSKFPTRPSAPVRFVLARGDAGGKSSAPQLNNGSVPPSISANYPPLVRDYVQRAYAALEREEDREKLEGYIRQRIEPVIRSGAVNTVNWTTEPLPHELNFTIRTGGWIPASKIKEKFENAQQKVKQARVEEPKPGMWVVGNNSALGSHSGRSEQQHTPTMTEADISYEPPPMFPKKQLIANPNNNKKKVQKAAMSAGLKPGNATGNWSVVEPLEKKNWRGKRFAAGAEKASRHRLSAQLRNEYLAGDFAPLNRTPEDIVGTCMEVEKPFFRLTAAPDPSQVRPLRVLVRALEMVKENYKANADYRYASDQLKSIRQDLMIQCIRNEFTLLVYESNARVALENRDREEFNQCQNQLRLLYSEVDPSMSKNRWEFTAYRLLYFVSMRDTLDVSTLLHEMTADALQDECMRFALAVWEAWSMGNYVRLLKLYADGPKMTGYVMDMFVERERRLFLASILKAYRPGISVAVIAAWFGMSPRKMVDWLAEKDIQAEVEGTLDCRQYSNAKL